MKLVDRFTLWYLGINIILIPVCSVITYYNIKHQADNGAIEKLRAINNKVASQVQRGVQPSPYIHGVAIAVIPLSSPLPEKTEIVQQREIEEDPELKQADTQLLLTNHYKINGQHYQLTAIDHVLRPQQLRAGLLYSILWKLVLLVFAVGITARLVSKYILASFHHTMNRIQQFSLKNKQKLSLSPTNTEEFNELNCFLTRMTDKAIEDYSSLKEFTENASHELQTPLSVIRSKLDLLSESEIHGQQAKLIGDMQNAVEKLSRIHRALALLTRLENQEYDKREEVGFGNCMMETLATFRDLIHLKDIQVKSYIQPIKVKMHPALMDILVSNLVSNAIRHNMRGGYIAITLNNDHLEISNTGRPPEVPTQELFRRFKKSNQCNDSIGIGLAIVKQICDSSNFDIQYDFVATHHIITVKFPTEEPSSKLLQNDALTLRENPVIVTGMQ